MADVQTADQVRSEHLDKLGPNLGPVFSQLRDDLGWLQVKWAEYRELYGTSPERIDLLNSAACLFFRILQDTLWDDALLHLCRLTDVEVMGKKRNLSIRSLPPLCDDPVVKAEIELLVDEAVLACLFARDWRNRRISHRDLTLALAPESAPLVDCSRAQVSAAIVAIHRVLNTINERLLHSELASDVITPNTGAEMLLSVLRDGLEADAARRERIRSGQFTSADLRRADI